MFDWWLAFQTSIDLYKHYRLRAYLYVIAAYCPNYRKAELERQALTIRLSFEEFRTMNDEVCSVES
jgi:hypothetical protein